MAMAFFDASATDAQTETRFSKIATSPIQGKRLTVCLLRVGRERVVIAVEREERAELHPSITQLFIRVSVETTGIDTELDRNISC